MTKEDLVTFLQDASAAIYMAESWAYSQSKLAQLSKARRQLKQAIQYFNEGNELV